MRCVVLTVVLGASSACFAQMTPADAFSQGKGVGAAGAAAAAGAITSGSGAATVPHYSTTQPQSGLFNGGNGLLVPAGTAQVSGCQSNAPDPDGRKQQQCEATNFLARRSGSGSFTIAPNDPVLVKSRPITADPRSILGSMSGTYSACTPQTVTAPARTQTEMCTESRLPEEAICSKRLSVTVTPVNSCVPGSWFAQGQANRNGADRMYAQALCEPERADGLLRFAFYAHGGAGACIGWQMVDLPTGISSGRRLLVDLAPHWEGFCWRNFKVALDDGSGCVGTSCSYSFLFGTPIFPCPGGQVNGDQLFISAGDGSTPLAGPESCFFTRAPDWSGCGSGETYAVDSGGSPVCARHAGSASVNVSGWRIGLAFTKPRVIHQETDTWDNQCAAMEARLP